MSDFERIMFTDNLYLCPKCGAEYEYISMGEYRCPKCGNTDKDDYGKVRDFIEENGPSSALTIAQGTSVPVLKIKQFLRQGRIEIPDGSSSYIKCEKCGEADIRFGRFCPECARELAKGLEGAFKVEDVGEVPKHNNSPKMHFLDKMDK